MPNDSPEPTSSFDTPPPPSLIRASISTLSAFRGNQRASLPLHPLEKALVWIAALNVCSLPWMLGGMRPWAQFISLGLSVLGFGLSLIPRHYAGSYVRAEAHTYYPHRKLLRWPIWWIGVLFFAYVLIQALNPAWEFVPRENGWSMRYIPDHITWLPTGMDTPFSMMNPWRQMMIWAAPFLLACSLWIGLTRRKALITLLTAVVLNATVLALVGMVARFTANGTILWLVKGIRDYAFASFVYKNHAGSFFALAMGLALALAVHFHIHAVRHHRRSSPASLLVFIAMVLLVAVLLSYSRAAILIVGVFLAITVVVGFVRLIANSGWNRAPFALVIFVVGAAVFGFLGKNLVNSEKTLDRINRLTNEEKTDRSVLSRQIAWYAGYEMAADRPVYGWGAGGFRFLFPRYQQLRPEIVWLDQTRKRRFMFWEHAHNDYLQTLIETGRVGLGLCLLAGLFALVSFVRTRGIRHLAALSLFEACGITLAHAAVDFPLQNPAILSTFAVAATLALILPAQEPRRSQAGGQRTEDGGRKAKDGDRASELSQRPL